MFLEELGFLIRPRLLAATSKITSQRCCFFNQQWVIPAGTALLSVSHLPEHRPLVSSLPIIQGSLPCSNKEITWGLGMWSPAYKKRYGTRLCCGKQIHPRSSSKRCHNRNSQKTKKKLQPQPTGAACFPGFFFSPAETTYLQRRSRNSGGKVEKQLRNSLRKKQTVQRTASCWHGCSYPLKAGDCSSPTSHLCTSPSEQGLGTPTPPERSPETRHWTPSISEITNTHPSCITQNILPKL